MKAALSARLAGALSCTLLAAALTFAPGAARADTYKCVVNGMTTYSSEPCGEHAEKVKPQISVYDHNRGATSGPVTGSGSAPVQESKSGVSALLDRVGLGNMRAGTLVLIGLGIVAAVWFLFFRKTSID